MHVQLGTFSLPKAGNSPEEYEDAAESTIENGHWDPLSGRTTQRLAIADGATESSFSKMWAELLCQQYCASVPATKGEIDVDQELEWFLENLATPRRNWKAEVEGLKLPWFAEEKVREGAFSSFLGCRLDFIAETRHVQWSTFAIGDSCLIKVKDNIVEKSFPIEHAEDFNNRPYLLRSLDLDLEVGTRFKTDRGELEMGSTIYLATDALAAWMLGHSETGEQREVFRFIDEVRSQSQFKAWIDSERTKSEELPPLRNDDVTLVRLELRMD